MKISIIDIDVAKMEQLILEFLPAIDQVSYTSSHRKAYECRDHTYWMYQYKRLYPYDWYIYDDYKEQIGKERLRRQEVMESLCDGTESIFTIGAMNYLIAMRRTTIQSIPSGVVGIYDVVYDYKDVKEYAPVSHMRAKDALMQCFEQLAEHYSIPGVHTIVTNASFHTTKYVKDGIITTYPWDYDALHILSRMVKDITIPGLSHAIERELKSILLYIS